jgi:hypothetical protein
MKTSTRAGKRVLASVTALAAVGTLASGMVAPPATASPWDPHVRVQGTATCGIIPNGKLQGLWLWTAEDGGAWYQYPGTSYSASYSRDLWNVPSSKTTVHVDIYCNGMKVHQTFGLARPAFGATATRNLYFRY